MLRKWFLWVCQYEQPLSHTHSHLIHCKYENNDKSSFKYYFNDLFCMSFDIFSTAVHCEAFLKWWSTSDVSTV